MLVQLTGACDMRIASKSGYQTDIAFSVVATLANGFEALAVTFRPGKATYYVLLGIRGNSPDCRSLMLCARSWNMFGKVRLLPILYQILISSSR